MKVLVQYRINRHVARCMSAANLVDAESRQSLKVMKTHATVSVPLLLEQLATAGDSATHRIREILIYLLDDDSLPAYFQALSSNSHTKVLSTVVRVLASSSTYNPSLLLPLFDNAETSKSALLKILSERKSGLAGAALLRKLSVLAPRERVALFKILEQIADESIVPELINRVSAQDVNTRLGIVRLLSRFNISVARSALLGRLMDSSKEIRFVALDALSKMNVKVDIGVLCKLLGDSDIKVRDKAIEAIIKYNDPATTKYLVDLLKDESEYVRRAAVEVLNGMEYPDAVEDLLKAMKDEDWWVRSRAADALAKIGGRRVVEAVIKLIRSEDEDIKRAAVEILNSTKDEESMNHLISALNDSDWWVRERAIDALASIGNKAALPALIKLMREDRQAAPIVLRAMTQLGDKNQVKDVITMLGSPDENIHVEAMNTLSELVDSTQSERVIKAIKRSAYSASRDVKEAARIALKRIQKRLMQKEALPDPHRRSTHGGKVVRSNAQPEKKIDIRALKPGNMIGERYEYIRRVGKGAFSTVLLVNDLTVKERIILKVLHDKMTSDEAMISRFIREIRYSRRINHTHVIRIYDFAKVGGLYAISMEYFSSVTLSTMLEPKSPLDFDVAINIASAVASGIDAAHKLNIIHRDLKPGNILINKEGMVKVVDFGIAKASKGENETQQLTKQGILIGTPRYMAPEQVTGGRLDGRSDIYSLGVILYEMLTGETAFKGDDNVQVLYRHVHGDIKPLREVNPNVPTNLSDVVTKMMSVNPRKRFQNMTEVEGALKQFKSNAA